MSNAGHLIWIVWGLLVGFGSSFIFGDLLTLPIDVYYLIYFGIIIAFFVIYIRTTNLNLKEWFSHRLVWGIVIGLIFGVFMVQNVVSRPPTERFAGAYLGWFIFWRGSVYGAIDGLFLTSFPWIVTWRAFDVGKKTLGKKITFGLLAWLFIILMTTSYHLGYSDFRSKKVLQANIGNTVMSIPTLVSANPISSAITHATLHIAAIIHSPKTELFLPPHRE